MWHLVKTSTVCPSCAMIISSGQLPKDVLNFFQFAGFFKIVYDEPFYQGKIEDQQSLSIEASWGLWVLNETLWYLGFSFWKDFNSTRFIRKAKNR